MNLCEPWSGTPDPKDPDYFWIDDYTGERVCAATGERTMPTLKKWYALLDTGDIACLGPKRDFFEADEAVNANYVWLFDEAEWARWSGQVTRGDKQ